MESSRAKVEAFKPVLLKAGIPLAISVAGFIFARITTRKISVSKASSSETQVNSLETNSHSLDSTSLPCMEGEHIFTDTHNNNSQESSQIQQKLDEEIFGLKSRIEDLQKREWELETRFLRYHNLKEQEIVLMEFRNNLLLEIARVEFLGREISSTEAENKCFEDMVVECLKALELLECSRLENGLLRKKAKRLLKKTKEGALVISRQNLQIEAREAEISRNHEELKRRAGTINGLEDEIIKLQTVMGRLQEEKNELMNKLELAEKSASLKIEAEGMITEDYNRLIDELEKLQKDRAAEVKEVIYLRWCNACLRHELVRRNQEQEGNLEEKQQQQLELDLEENGEIKKFSLEGDISGHGQPCLGLASGSNAHSKRPRLIEKFKRWVEKTEKVKGKLDEKEKHELKCFGSHSVSDGAQETQIPSRNSCSST